MRIGSFQSPGGPAYGPVVGDSFLNLAHAAGITGAAAPPPDLTAFLAGGAAALEQASALAALAGADPQRFAPALQALATAQYLPPVGPRPRLFALMGNSCLMSRQLRLVVPEVPIFALRHPHNLVGHNHLDTVAPGQGGWNPELVAVLGKGGRNIPPEGIAAHIAGYTLMMDRWVAFPGFGGEWKVPAIDPSDRDRYYEGQHYLMAFAPYPVGPWIVTADAVPDPHDLWMVGRESGSAASPLERGRLVEKVHTSAVLFRFQEAFSYISRFVTLQPGDMLASGAFGYDGYPAWDQYASGGYLEAECEGIGRLRINFGSRG